MMSPASPDLQPTDRLTGLHMLGMVERRFLINYPVPVELLQSHLPPGSEFSQYNQTAWVSACFVKMRNMRPSFMSGLPGMGYNYLIHRTRARLPFPDGSQREAVLVLQPNLNRRLVSWGGSLFTSIRFHTRSIRFTEDDQQWRIQMNDGKTRLFDATISKDSVGRELPSGSCFESAEQADQQLLGVSYGGQWNPRKQTLNLLPETHEPWETLACQCQTHKNAFLEDLGLETIEDDHAITMTNIPHYFGIRPWKQRLTCGA